MADLTLTGSCDLTAADGTKPPRVSIVAYTGGAMQVGGFGQVVVDLAGVSLPRSLPLLADHETTLGAVVGAGVPTVESGRLLVSGQLDPGAPAAQQIISLHRTGVPWQASVGVFVDHKATRKAKAGESVTVNGRTLVAGREGLSVIRGSLREVSITALGADADTSVSIAARAAKGSSTMFEPTTLNTTAAPETADPIAAERERGLRIMSLYGDRHSDLRAKAIGEGWDLDRAELELHRANAKGDALECLRASRPNVGQPSRGGASPATRDVLTASLMLRAGHADTATKAFGERTVQAADESRITSLVDLAAAALRAEGRDVPRGSEDMLQAAFSTTNLPNILGDALHKILDSTYRDAPTTWRSFAAIRNVKDFRDHTTIRPRALRPLELLPNSGEVPHGTLEEESMLSYSVDTYAQVLRVDRKQVINDDLGFLATVGPELARAAARKLADLIWSTILANAGDHFGTGNANYATTGSALAIGSLGTGVSAMRSQRDVRGNDIDMRPSVLVVPPGIEMTAKGLLNSTDLGKTDGSPTGNPLRSITSLEVESRIANSDKFTGASGTQWYLFAGSADVPLVVAFLEGQQSPRVVPYGMDHDPDHLGVAWRCHHDFGCVFGDPKAGYKATGAA